MDAPGFRRHGFSLAFASLAAGLLLPASASAQIAGTVHTGQDGACFGSALANAGDTDGDGIDDLLVGESYFDTSSWTNAGRVSLYSGATMVLIRTTEGTETGQRFGAAVAGAGDVDLDGYADYVVGAPGTDQGSTITCGMAVVYSGADGSEIWTCYGGSAFEQFGLTVAGLGDIDGDAKSDVLVGTAAGHYVTALDENGSVIYTLTGSSTGGFGTAVAACGDLDRDGVSDFVVNEPFADSKQRGFTVTRGGLVHACSAATGSELFTVGGVYTDDKLGMAVAGLGDVNGDGFPDLIAGSSVAIHTGTGAGVFVVASGKDGARLQTVYGANNGDQLGRTVAGLGDMDHDGVPDYAVGAPGTQNGGFHRGLVQVRSGATRDVLWEWLGDADTTKQNLWLGTGLAAGDFNGDGIADVVLGDQEFETYSTWTGLWSAVGGAFEYFGCPAWTENYGSGWSGKNGVPGLIALDDPVPGNLLTLKLDNSFGQATVGVLFLGFTQVSVPTGKGGTILVSPFLTIPLAIPASGLLLTGTLPDDPALNFFEIDLQAIEADPFASEGLSFTPGLLLHCGIDLP